MMFCFLPGSDVLFFYRVPVSILFPFIDIVFQMLMMLQYCCANEGNRLLKTLRMRKKLISLPAIMLHLLGEM